MPRPLRHWLGNLPAHVIVRGNDKQAIFHCDGDRLFMLGCLARYAAPVAIHSYVLMPNHMHFIVSAGRPLELSKMMQDVGRRYVRYFNDRYGRTGTLFEGRFKAAGIQVERYLFKCHQYIDSNPVRSGLAVGPGEHPWSSYRKLAWGVPDDLVTPHPLVLATSADERERQRVYREMFAAPLSEDDLDRIRKCTHRGWLLATADYCREVEHLTGRKAEPLPRGRPRKATTENLF